MRALRILVALLLALVWLPATVHCGLDAAGLLAHADSCCSTDEHHSPHSSKCGADGCDVVESGGYQVTGGYVKIPTPLWRESLLTLIASVPALVEESEFVVVEAVESPPEMKRTWHIVSRAALSPRAPSLIAA